MKNDPTKQRKVAVEYVELCGMKHGDTTQARVDSRLSLKEIAKQLGIKVYFDKKDLPYVLSHELAELIGKPNNKLMRDIRNLYEKINNSEESKIGHIEKSGLFSIIEGTYINLEE